MTQYYLLLLFFILPILSISAQNPLPACPKSPNCFRSEVDGNRKAKQALKFEGDLKNAQEKLIQLLAAYSGAELVRTDKEIIAYIFTTKIGKFRDQVSFYFDDKNKTIHFRSASDVGWSDLGANKRRMKKIRKMWEGSLADI